MSDYPNIEAIAAGTISGAFREWPRVRKEARALLRTVEDERKYRLQNAEYAVRLEAALAEWRKHDSAPDCVACAALDAALAGGGE